MGRGVLSRRALTRIERHQRAHADHGRCNFRPTCSSYAHTAFQTRAFPVAMAMAIGRVIRCNGLVRHRVDDPVARRRRLRPNALATFGVLMTVSGLFALVFASAAYGDSFSGGCTGSANGRDISGMTSSNPLVLKQHRSFQAQGTASFAGPNDTTSVDARFEIISGLIGVSNKSDGGTGNSWSSSAVSVDEYFDIGLGLYKVNIRVSGGGGSCEGTAYVKLDGNPLTKPIGIAGAAGTALGAGSVVASRRKGPSPRNDTEEFINQMLEPSEKKEAAVAANPENPEVDDMGIYEFVGWFFGCSPFGVIGILLLALPVFGMGAGAAASARPVVWSKRVRVKGRPVIGFISGVVAALGAVILLWQYAVWTLQIWNAIGIPIAVGVLAAVWAWRGRSILIRVRRAEGAAAPDSSEAT